MIRSPFLYHFTTGSGRPLTLHSKRTSSFSYETWLVGAFVRVGATRTASSSPVSRLSSLFSALHWYPPSSSNCMFLMVRLPWPVLTKRESSRPVSSSLPSRNQDTLGCGTPLAAHSKVTSCPSSTAWLDGVTRKDGGSGAVDSGKALSFSVAPEEVTPATLHLYVARSPMLTLVISRAPEGSTSILWSSWRGEPFFSHVTVCSVRSVEHWKTAVWVWKTVKLAGSIRKRGVPGGIGIKFDGKFRPNEEEIRPGKF